tara:strand:- start:5 stop:283 length:279 start_codon:yes stop_codon:yes gene_type:complete
VRTSGGDCAWLNAAIRAIPFRAIAGYGWQVYGIWPGKHGLMKRPVDAERFAGNIFTEHVLRLGGIGHDVGDLIEERMETYTCVLVLGHYSVV